MIQKILEQCQKGSHGVGFNEVVLMLYNSVATAEVYMNMDDKGTTFPIYRTERTRRAKLLSMVLGGKPGIGLENLPTQIGSGSYQSATP